VAVATELRATIERPGMVTPQAAISAIRSAMAPEDILISDVGAHKLWLGRLFPAYEPNTVIISNGFATMGIGLPGAIAAKLALPERRIVTVSGDGGFLMNVQEMETATRLGVPVVVVLWVDGKYGVIGWKQERRFGRTYAIEFGNPDFAGLAASFGWAHRETTDGGALRDALAGALDGEVPTLITVPIDYRQNVRLANLGEPSLGA
ncbi:MAG: acetolactate synthase large subunit, partial [Miltoncostaeaceae bacterium]|nr:acetolactate synthase large subunit [Miltoncostaeaceae bacterium]